MSLENILCSNGPQPASDMTLPINHPTLTSKHGAPKRKPYLVLFGMDPQTPRPTPNVAQQNGDLPTLVLTHQSTSNKLN